MDISATVTQSTKLTTPKEKKEAKEAISSEQCEEQASSSTYVNDAIYTHEPQQRTESPRNSPSKNKKRIGPQCNIDDQSRYDFNLPPTRMLYSLYYVCI